MVETAASRALYKTSPNGELGGALRNHDLLLQLRRLAVRGVLPAPHAKAPQHSGAPQRIGVIVNPKSHRSRPAQRLSPGECHPQLLSAAPETRDAMVEVLADYARRGVDLLVIDGGDGTVRDVISAAAPIFGNALPLLALLPHGKTNALALDLGIPPDWDIPDIVEAAAKRRFIERVPIEIAYEDSEFPLRGFIMGASAFVRGTMLAQRTHRLGAFDGLAVGLSVLGAICQTCMGSRSNPWRSGETVSYTEPDTGARRQRDVYLILASTLSRMPPRIRPTGAASGGLDMLVVDAPPRLLPLALPLILAGREGGWLQRAGYHHFHRIDPVSVWLENGFILDGEMFPGGEITIGAGAPIRFVAP